MALAESLSVRETWTDLFGNRRIAIAVLCIVLLAHALVNVWLFKSVELPPFYDGANHFNIAADLKEHLDDFRPTLGWFDQLYEISSYYPPCFHLAAALCMKVVGISLDSARLPNLLFLGILVFSVFLLGERLFDTKTGLLSGVLISLFPVVHGLTREIYVDLAVLAWAACAVYLLLATNRFQSGIHSFLFGAVCGLGLLTKWTFPVFIGGPFLWVFCETFLPFSLFGLFIHVVGAGKERGSRETMIGRSVLALGGWLVFAFGLTRFLGDGSSFLLGACLSFLGFVVFAASQLERGGVPSVRSIFERTKRPIPPWTRSLGCIFIASIPALILAGPWFLKHFGFIASEGSRVLTEAAEVRGMARVGTASSFFYYLLTLESHQLHLPYWLLALAALATLATRRAFLRSPWFLGIAFAVSYLVMSSLWVKDPRYFTPGIYPLPILMAWWLLSRRKEARLGWVAGAIAIGVVGYLNQIFGLPLLSDRVTIPTPLGQPIQVTGSGVYGNLLQYKGAWPHRALVETIQKDAATNRHLEGPLRVPVLVDDGFLHAPALNCYARVLDASIHFYNIAYHPDYRSDPGFTTRLLNVLKAPYFITKQGDYLGLGFVAGAYQPLLERLIEEEEGWSAGAAELASYSLPSSGTTTLWSNNFPTAYLGAREKIDAKLVNGMRIESFRRSRTEAIAHGLPEIVQIEWTPDSLDNLEKNLDSYQFFLHLEEAETGRFIQGWNANLSTEEPGVAEFQLKSASPSAVVSTLLLKPRVDLIPGVYQLRLGVFDVASLAKVAVADPIEEIETSVALGDEFLFEPVGWEWIHAAFEDREALKVRDEIGSVVLESAHFEPSTVRPGGEITLETHWSVRWLELEDPKEQDVRAIAYLLPATPGPESQPVSRIEWTLDVLGHSGPEIGRWSTKVHIPFPSDIEEGEWKLHIGVYRPQYERPLVIRDGQQADRRSFVLRDPLLVGLPDWSRIEAEYPNGLRLEAGRVLDVTPVVGANLDLELSWRAESATLLIKAASHAFLFAHLFSLADQAYAQLETLPVFRRDGISAPGARATARTGYAFFEAIRGGFSERHTIPLKETLPPGAYRLDFGLYFPGDDRKEIATFPKGSTTTTIHLPKRIGISLPE